MHESGEESVVSSGFPHRPGLWIRRWEDSVRGSIWWATRGAAVAFFVVTGIGWSGVEGPEGSLGRDLRARLVAEVEAKGLNPAEIVFPDTLTEEIRQWLRDNVKTSPSPKETITGLLRAMTEPGGLALVYAPGYTGTAAEAFRSQQANCLAFTHLMVGMSRELGIPTYYVNYELVERFRRSGDLIVVSGHISAGYGSGAEGYLLEFGDLADLDRSQARPISDLNALARYYANRAAELLEDGQVEDALAWAETATRLEPALAEGWSNLGVALRRSGRLDAAESAYLQATEVDPEYHVAYHNLFALMRLRGESEAAREILELLDRRNNRNPFIYLELGDQSLASQRLAEAGRFYERASKVGSELAETWAARGGCALDSGKVRKARRWLKKAQRRSPDDPRTIELEQRLLEFEGVLGIESGL
ncbi:MAG: tetratricopeptide repeat protein [Thermoanaerobaculia bacterium]